MATNEDFMNYQGNTDYGLEITPALIQWRRGDLTNQNPLLRDGCWQLPSEQWEGLVNAEPINVLHGGGVVVPSFLFGKLHFAVLTYRSRWYIQNGDNTTWLAPGVYEEGAKSRLQIWAYVKELDEFAIITVSGMNAKYLKDAITQTLTKNIIAPAGRQAKKSFARFHFWLPLSSAGKMATDHNQHITPPTCPISRFDIDTLRSLFVGSEVAERCESEMALAQEWAKAKEQPKPESTKETEESSDEFDEVFPPRQPAPVGIAEDEIPF